MRTEKTNEYFKIILSNSLTINQIQSVYFLFKDALESHLPIQIDGNELKNIDSTGMQLIAIFHQYGTTKGAQITWTGNKELLEKKSSVLGISKIIEKINHQ